MRYDDHHWYRPADWDQMARAAEQAGAQTIVTTEKDAVKLPEGPPLPVWVLRSEMSPVAGAEAVAAALDGLARGLDA